MKKMKFTTSDLVKHLGFEVGDEVALISGYKYELKETKDEEGYILVDADGFTMSVADLIDLEFEHYKRKKKVGEKKCCEFANCNTCPLSCLNCDAIDSFERGSWPLYKILNETFYSCDIGNSEDPIYKAFRSKLDKEVE